MVDIGEAYLAAMPTEDFELTSRRMRDAVQFGHAPAHDLRMKQMLYAKLANLFISDYV